ncbi:MAG: RNA polymerase factor sigma-32 [Deltaproteobacteria bacterium]|nr:RNA polymerase factor sigma-32 [Deltaproteobacteria bacterium]
MTTALALHQDSEFRRYVAEVARTPLLSRDEELTLARRLRDEGDVAAAHQLVVSNLRFVVKIAYEYRGYGLRLLDLVQEGNIGLMKAVKKFDPEKGYRLISYAVWWIRAHIHDYIMRSWSLVKLGAGHVRRKLFFKLRSEKSRFEQLAGDPTHDSSDAALALHLGVSESDLAEMDVRMAARDFSLDAPVAVGADSSHLDAMSEPEPDQEAALGAKEERRLLQGALADAASDLDEKERFVLESRLLADEPATLAEIGDHFGVSRERARQIETRVIGKLRDAMQRPPRLLPHAAVAP